MQKKQHESRKTKDRLDQGDRASSKSGLLNTRIKNWKWKATEYFITKDCHSLLYVYKNNPDGVAGNSPGLGRTRWEERVAGPSRGRDGGHSKVGGSEERQSGSQRHRGGSRESVGITR